MKASMRSLLLASAIAFFVFAPINGAEPDPKSVAYSLPDKIEGGARGRTRIT